MTNEHDSVEPIPILHEESHFLIVNKPAGLFSQAAAGIASLQTKLQQQLALRDAHPGQPFIGLPHRLDRGTSGIMLIARNQRALRRFNEQFHSRKVKKLYLAIVEGEATELAREQMWEDFVRKIPDQPQAEICASDTEGARQASAKAFCLSSVDGLSLLRVELLTGRMHQIRVQAAARGWCVLGDAAYGGQRAWPAAANQSAPHLHPPIALHAWQLEFHHPQSAKRLRFAAAPPSSWQSVPVFAQTQLPSA